MRYGLSVEAGWKILIGEIGSQIFTCSLIMKIVKDINRRKHLFLFISNRSQLFQRAFLIRISIGRSRA